MNAFAPIASLGFWVLLVAGWMLGELQVRGIVVFVLLWLAGLAAASALHFPLLFTPYVAVLDIVLVLAIFKGDITLH
jgi:hypothetical protein